MCNAEKIRSIWGDCFFLMSIIFHFPLIRFAYKTLPIHRTAHKRDMGESLCDLYASLLFIRGSRSFAMLSENIVPARSEVHVIVLSWNIR
jgi:presenilin-like A22 family membrane protease